MGRRGRGAVDARRQPDCGADGGRIVFRCVVRQYAQRGAGEVARQLARGVRSALAVGSRPADVGIATTGVAGPDGQGGRAPGTVFLGISHGDVNDAVELALTGTRTQIRARSVDAAVRLLIERLL